MTQAVEDGATRPVYYESRVIKLHLDKDTLALIDATYDALEQQSDTATIEKSKKMLGQMESVFALLCLLPCAAAVHIKVNFKPRGFYKVSTLYKKGAEPSGFPEALRAFFRCQNRSSILSR